MAHTDTTAPDGPTSAKLGSIFLPASPGTPVGRFSFVVDADDGGDVQIGSAVAAETVEGVLIGTVVDMRTIGTDTDPIRADLTNEWNPDRIGGIQPVMVADVQVYSSDMLRPPRAGLVRAATAAEVLEATGASKMGWPIPCGVVDLIGGVSAPAYLDGDFLMGPEGQGISVGGISGVASKTSFVGFLLKSTLNSGSRDEHPTAALIFNVKGEDLIWLDEPVADDELTDVDREIYASVGLTPEPFDDVEVWSPSLPASVGGGTMSPRDDARTLEWDLRTVWDNLWLLDPDLMDNDNTSAFIQMARDRLVFAPGAGAVDTFDKLEAFFESEISSADEEQRTDCWGSIHLATMRKLRRRFGRIRESGRGLFTGSRTSADRDIPTEGWRHGQVTVVDIAGLPREVQGFVIARTVSRIMRAAEEGTLGVEHLAIVADEGNEWVPAVGGEHPAVKRALKKVAIQGRYAGVSLWLAGQQLSRIDELIRDNAGTRALGISREAELSSGTYGKLPSGLAERLATLPKGQMALWHYSYRQALIVRFPRPAWRTGRAKTTGRAKRVPASLTEAWRAHVGMTADSYAKLTQGVDPVIAEQIVAGAASAEEAASKLAKVREPDMSTVAVHARSAFDPDDPFCLD